MLTPEKKQFLIDAYNAAKSANHRWPGAAAAEASEETGWGQHMPPKSNNVLGIKVYKGWIGGMISANGTEQSANGSWSGPQRDLWCIFSSMEDCFREQMKILQEPRYAPAMAATTTEDYITSECRTWSTGLAKGQQVLIIYRAHKDLLNA
jgi:hypothetical protein